MKIRFAVSAVSAISDGSGLDTFAEEVATLERLGFDTVWLSDIPLGATLDPIVGLSFAAAATSTLKLGANLVPIGRNPLTLAKSLAQVDQLSGGRILLSFVVGIDQPGEREALGATGVNRGKLLEVMTPWLRTWWAGDPVTQPDGHYRFDRTPSPGRSFQQPLEVWFGGSGPGALARAGRVADGWLGSALTPGEAGRACRSIEAAAAGAGRTIDPEHFGLSIPYAAGEPDDRTVAFLRSRRARHTDDHAELSELLPVGPDQLRELVKWHVDEGLSKFVIRPIDRDAAAASLADVLLPLQT